jgi:Nucleotide-diphospho-sugar transferase
MQATAAGQLAGSASIGSAAGPRPGCAAIKGNCDLEGFLKMIAPSGEVLVAISNFNLVAWGGMLNTWLERVQKAGVTNYMVLAIDEQLHTHLNNRGVPNFYMPAEIAAVQQGTGSNHAVSALKFGILAEFLKLGWSVLLSDVDIVTLSDPFQHLYRDRDIEGTSYAVHAHLHCFWPTYVAVLEVLQPAMHSQTPALCRHDRRIR